MNNNSGSYSRVLYEETHNTSSSSCDARGRSKRVALLSIWIINISDGDYKGERVLRMTQITNVFAFSSFSTGPTFRPSRWGSHQQITTLFCLILRWWQCKFIQQRLINHNPFSSLSFSFSFKFIDYGIRIRRWCVQGRTSWKEKDLALFWLSSASTDMKQTPSS